MAALVLSYVCRLELNISNNFQSFFNLITIFSTKTSSSRRAVWVSGCNNCGVFGIGNDDTQKQLMKCGWSEKIQIRNIYVSNHYTVVEDMNGNYYSAGYNGYGACTVNDESDFIITMTPITYF
eukprot:96237_1